MLPAIVCVLALSSFNLAQAPPRQNPPTKGTHEVTTPPQRNTSSGMTLEALRGLPRTRPTWSPPQPQVWVYQPVVVYPAYSPSLGGYRPAGVGRSYRPWGLWWGW